MQQILNLCGKPQHRYDKRSEELYDLMSEYDELEDKYIMLGGEKETY